MLSGCVLINGGAMANIKTQLQILQNKLEKNDPGACKHVLHINLLKYFCFIT